MVLGAYEGQPRAPVGGEVVPQARHWPYGTYRGLSYDVAFDAGANSVVVRVRAPLDLPLTVPGGPATATIGAVGSAAVLAED